jgi:hypothetical protein
LAIKNDKSGTCDDFGRGLDRIKRMNGILFDPRYGEVEFGGISGITGLF